MKSKLNDVDILWTHFKYKGFEKSLTEITEGFRSFYEKHEQE